MTLVSHETGLISCETGLMLDEKGLVSHETGPVLHEITIVSDETGLVLGKAAACLVQKTSCRCSLYCSKTTAFIGKPASHTL